MPSKPTYLRPLLLLLGVVLLLAVGIGAFLYVRKAVSQGTVVVHIQPPEATLFIDGEPQDRTAKKYLLADGPHTFRVESESYEPEVRDVDVKAGRVVTEEFRLRRPRFETISIRSDPAGATVYI